MKVAGALEVLQRVRAVRVSIASAATGCWTNSGKYLQGEALEIALFFCRAEKMFSTTSCWGDDEV